MQSRKVLRRSVLKGIVVGTAAPGLLLRPGASAAAAFSERPLKLVHSTSPGGTVDLVARIMAERMAPYLGQTVLVDHRPGGPGAIGATFVTRCPKDGYAFHFGTSSSLGYQKMLNKDLAFDPVNDFTPVALVGSVPVGVFVATDGGFNTIQDLIGAARARPGQLSYGSTGPLGLTHLAGELLQYRAGIRMTHIPYTGAQQRSWTDMIGGSQQLTLAGVGGGMALVKAGQLNLLAVASRKRSKLLPDVPALGELFPGTARAVHGPGLRQNRGRPRAPHGLARDGGEDPVGQRDVGDGLQGVRPGEIDDSDASRQAQERNIMVAFGLRVPAMEGRRRVSGSHRSMSTWRGSWS